MCNVVFKNQIDLTKVKMNENNKLGFNQDKESCFKGNQRLWLSMIKKVLKTTWIETKVKNPILIRSKIRRRMDSSHHSYHAQNHLPIT